MVYGSLMGMKHIKMDHIHFFATDLDEAVRFYTDLGCEFVQRFEHGGREAVQLRTQFGTTIDINKTRAADNPGYSHFSILIDDILVYLFTCLPVYLFTCLPVYPFTRLPFNSQP